MTKFDIKQPSFTADFDSESSCISHFKAHRDKIGVVCKCGYTEHY